MSRTASVTALILWMFIAAYPHQVPLNRLPSIEFMIAYSCNDVSCVAVRPWPPRCRPPLAEVGEKRGRLGVDMAAQLP